MERECGSCTLCCKLLGVDEISKPQGEWCSHCNIGVGCKIYRDRPNECKNFTCMWIAELLPLEMKPNEVGAVFTLTKGDITVDVDPVKEDAYKRGWVKRGINQLVAKGNTVKVFSGKVQVAQWPTVK